MIGKSFMNNVKRGSIYYANLNPITGSEQGGERPVVVLQNDCGNKYSPTTIIAPITTKIYKGKNMPTHIIIKSKKLRKNSIILLEQIRTIDKSRIKNYIDALDENEMNLINIALITSLDIY